MKAHFILIILLLFCHNTINGQTYSLKEYTADDVDFSARYMQETADGNFVITASKDCHIPGGIAIEGCPIARTLMKINSMGDTIWTSDIGLWHNSMLGMFENAGAPFSFLTSRPVNFTCGDISVSLYGYQRTSLYKLSDVGQVIETIDFNDECMFNINDYVELENGDVLLLATMEDESFERETQLVQLDPEFTIKNSITMDTDGSAFRQMLLTPAGNIHILKQNYETQLFSLIQVDTLGNLLDEITLADNISISFIDNMMATSDNDLLFTLGVRDLDTEEVYLELKKTSFDGTPQWTKRIDGLRRGTIIESTNQEIILATTRLNADESSEDIYLDFYNLNGDSLYQKIYDNNGKDDYVAQVFETSQNELFILGGSNGLIASQEPSTVFLIKDTLGNNVTSLLPIQEEIIVNIFPNPASSELQVEIKNGDQTTFSLEIINAQGTSMLLTSVAESSTIPLMNYPTGIYFVRIMDADGKGSIRRFVKVE